MSSENIAINNFDDKKKRTRRRGGIRARERRHQMRASKAMDGLQKFLNDKTYVFKSEPTSIYYLPSGLLDDEEEPHYYLPSGLLDDEEEPHYYLPFDMLHDVVCFPPEVLDCRLNPNARAYYPLRSSAPEYIPH